MASKEELTVKATSLVKELRENLQSLVREMRGYEEEQQTTSFLTAEEQQRVLLVQKSDMERLASEAMMLKEFLHKVLSTEYIDAMSKLTQVETELHGAIREKEEAIIESKVALQRAEAVIADYEQEKQEKFSAKYEIHELTQQLSQQADYCSSMGAACCTMLWKVSRQEESVQAILSGSKVSDFLCLVGRTLESYITTYSDESLQCTEEESQFVLALCGIITNIAASAYGRNYLASQQEGLEIVDIFCSALAGVPQGTHCSKLMNLILMALFNISINHKGLQYLTSKRHLMKELVWLLQNEREASNKLNTLRLLHSMVLEPKSLTVVHQALESVPVPLLQQLSADQCPEVRELALELMSNLDSLSTQTNTNNINITTSTRHIM